TSASIQSRAQWLDADAICDEVGQPALDGLMAQLSQARTASEPAHSLSTLVPLGRRDHSCVICLSRSWSPCLPRPCWVQRSRSPLPLPLPESRATKSRRASSVGRSLSRAYDAQPLSVGPSQLTE